MHVDGGATPQVFNIARLTLADLSKRQHRARAASLHHPQRWLDRIGPMSPMQTLVLPIAPYRRHRLQGLGDLYRIYLTSATRIDFNLAYIPESFNALPLLTSLSIRTTWTSCSSSATRWLPKGYPWSKTPPGFGRRNHAEVRRSCRPAEVRLTIDPIARPEAIADAVHSRARAREFGVSPVRSAFPRRCARPLWPGRRRDVPRAVETDAPFRIPDEPHGVDPDGTFRRGIRSTLSRRGAHRVTVDGFWIDHACL